MSTIPWRNAVQFEVVGAAVLGLIRAQTCGFTSLSVLEKRMARRFAKSPLLRGENVLDYYFPTP